MWETVNTRQLLNWVAWIPILLIASSLAAQQSLPPAPTGTGNANAGDCLRRSVPLTLLTASQDSPWHWQALQVLVGGKAAPIVSFSRDARPPRVLLLVDTSGSMSVGSDIPGQSPSGWGVGLLAAVFAVEATPQDSLVSLGTFADEGKVWSFQSRKKVSEEVLALASQSPKGRTALYLAISKALSQFNAPQFGDTIFLVTDGGDNRSGELRNKVQKELVARGVRVFVFFVTHRFMTPEEREAPADMADLARSTGGGLIQALWSKKWIAGAEAAHSAEEIRNQVRWPYRLEFQLEHPLDKTAKLKISVPPENKSLELAYPRHVEPCTVSRSN